MVALGLFAVLAAPSWPGTVDDVYITLAYARQWAEQGALEWTTGERVEGYSNFLFLALMALGARVGADIDLLAQLVALVSAGGLLVAFARRLPASPVGTLALLALAAWAPLNHWGVIGLETTFYTALLAAGWSCVLGPAGRWGLGISLLAAASITRPEGALQLIAAASTVLLRADPNRHGRGLAAAALIALAGYHAARIGWFGAALPTSVLVKVSPIGLTPFGALQLAGDLLTASGLILTLLLAARLSVRDALWVGAPLAIQAATLIRASGDWMAWGRLTLPGLVASALAVTTLATWRAVPRRTLALAALVVIAASALEPHGYGAIDLRPRSARQVLKSVAHLRHGLDTPIAEDVSWVIDNVPLGAAGLVVDAGILGDIPAFRLIDMRGLNHRPAAEAIAENRAEAWLRDTLSDPVARPPFLRLASWDSVTHPDYPEWLIGGYSLRADLRYGGGSIRWYAMTDARPTPAERRSRWDEMLRRHPSHPFLAWHAALSAAESGELERASLLAARAAARWPSMAEFTDAPDSYAFTRGTSALDWEEGRGFALSCEEALTTRLVSAHEAVAVALVGDSASRARISDPCDAGAADALRPNDAALLATCAQPRRVTVTLTCEPGLTEPAYIRLTRPR